MVQVSSDYITTDVGAFTCFRCKTVNCILLLNSESKLCSSFLIEMEKNILLRLTVTYCLPEAVNLLQQRNHIWHGR